MNPTTMNKILKAVEHARAKHKFFAISPKSAMPLAMFVGGCIEFGQQTHKDTNETIPYQEISFGNRVKQLKFPGGYICFSIYGTGISCLKEGE